MITEPLVSIIMPAYNAGRYIAEAVQSVLDQVYQNWELLVVNDGSRDNTLATVTSFRDARISVFSQENNGVSAARNTALAHMKGAYFTFLDADDRLTPDSLQKRISFAARNPAIDFIAGSVTFFHEKGAIRTWKPSYKGDPLQAFIRIDERAFCNPALLIKRHAHLQYRFKEGMTHVEDLLFFATAAQQAPQQYDYIKEVVYEYRVSGGSAMNNLSGLEQGYWEFYQSVRKYPNANPSDLRYLKARITRIMFLSYLAAGKFLSAMRVLPKFVLK